MIDLHELRRLAQAAKNSCESVEWFHEFRSGRYSQGVITSGEENILIVCGANYGCWRDADDDGDSQFKALGDFVAAANPATISELLSRLEAAEKERDEFKRECFGHISDNSLLRAKIEAMEQQEPSAWCATDETETVVEALGMNQSRRFDTALYLAPGAKGG